MRRQSKQGSCIPSASLIWIAVAFINAACWGAMVVINKKALAYIDPTVMNFLMRVIAVVGLVCVGIPLSLLHVWNLGLGIDLVSLAYIVGMSVVIYAVSLQAYYFALRVGRVAVVAPITATDPLWTALFAVVLVGATLSHGTLVGLAVATVGVVLVSRFQEHDPEPLGDVLPPRVETGPGAPAATGRRGFQVVLLSVLTAACWGVGPVLVERAIAAYGELTATMIIASQVTGVLLLGPVLLVRRRPLFSGVFTPAQRRAALTLVLACGVIETVYEVVLYTLIDEIGSVLMVLILALAPVWAMAGAALFLKERPGWKTVLAGALTLTGVLIATLATVLT